MEITYKNNKIEKICTNAQAARKKIGSNNAVKLAQRLDQIRAASCVKMLIDARLGRCHPLHGDREGQYAMDLEHPMRLVFTVIGEPETSCMIEIVDYH